MRHIRSESGQIRRIFARMESRNFGSDSSGSRAYGHTPRCRTCGQAQVAAAKAVHPSRYAADKYKRVAPS